MAARAIWKGELKLNSSKVPVKLYAAVKDQTVRFHILDEKSKTRVKQHMVESDKGKEVPHEEIHKGFEVEPGTFVILEEEELEKDLPRPAGRAPEKKELSMAKQLVGLLKGEFDPKEFKDEYRERVMEFVEKKGKGHKPRLHLVKSKKKTTSLDKVLSKSIEHLKKQKKAA